MGDKNLEENKSEIMRKSLRIIHSEMQKEYNRRVTEVDMKERHNRRKMYMQGEGEECALTYVPNCHAAHIINALLWQLLFLHTALIVTHICK